MSGAYHSSVVVAKRGGGERTIPPEKISVDRSTDRGEDADLYELLPHDGRRRIDHRTIIRMEPREQAALDRASSNGEKP